MVTINLDEELDQDFERIPEGEYKATVFEAEVDTDRSGNDRLYVTFKIQEGQYEDRRLFANWGFVNNQHYFLRREFLDQIDHGLSGDVEPADIVEAVLGRPCRIKVVHESDFRDEKDQLHDDGLIAQVDRVYRPKQDNSDGADFIPD